MEDAKTKLAAAGISEGAASTITQTPPPTVAASSSEAANNSTVVTAATSEAAASTITQTPPPTIAASSSEAAGTQPVSPLQRFQAAVRPVGDHTLMLLVWAVVGLAAGTVFPIYIIGEDSTVQRKISSCMAAFMVTAFFFSGGAILKHSKFLRTPPFWYVKLAGNNFFTFVILVVSVEHLSNPRGIISQLYMGITIFTLFEICRPSHDFGILIYFLRLPLITSFLQMVKHLSVQYLHFFCISLAVYLFCTTWSCYFVAVFEEDQRIKKKYDEEKGIRVGKKSAVDVSETPPANDENEEESHPLIC